MKQRLQQLQGRIDALALRERVFLLVTCIVCVLALADLLWLTPAQNVQRQLAADVRKDSAELEALREQLRVSLLRPGALDSTLPLRQQRTELEQRLLAVERDITAASGTGAGSSNPLTQVLVQFLRRQPGLTLLRTGTLTAEAAAPAQAVAAPVATAKAAALPQLTRQGVELTVSGAYPELVRYVQNLEQALPTLHWGRMKLGSERQPPELSLQVYLLEVSL